MRGGGGGSAWGGDLIVFVGPGVWLLTDLVVAGVGGGDVWIFLRPTWRYLTADSDEKDWDWTLCFLLPRFMHVPHGLENLEIIEANGNKRKLSGFHCLSSNFLCFSIFLDRLNLLRYCSIKVNGSEEKQSRFLQVQLISVWFIRYNHCIKLVKLTFFAPLIKILRMVYLNLQSVDFLLKGFYILCSVTRIIVKTYNCSCNRNMYLWWCSNVYKWRLQSFIWRYFHCAFLGFCLGIFGSNVQPGVGKFGSSWLEWFACGQGIWRQIFKTVKCPPHTLPPHRWLYIDKCITSAWKFCLPPSPPVMTRVIWDLSLHNHSIFVPW